EALPTTAICRRLAWETASATCGSGTSVDTRSSETAQTSAPCASAAPFHSSNPAMSAKNFVTLRLPLADGRLRLRRQRFGAARIELLVPIHHPRNRDHDQDADQADENLRPGSVRDFDQEEMPGERQEDAETEDLERMLAADDGGTESAPFEIRPIA